LARGNIHNCVIFLFLLVIPWLRIRIPMFKKWTRPQSASS
jgi:hypothetical protein